MFAFIAKKISMPERGSQLTCVSWNKSDHHIVCGGDDGLLKVLRLDDDQQQKRTKRGATNLAMNQNLEGHNDVIKVVAWNERYQKLTSSDAQGMIIVWQLHKGMWFEEMINNRNKSVVTDMKWTPDGSRVCIVYADGAIIVGSVDGNREWGRDLEDTQLTNVEWSPNGKSLLFGTTDGEIHCYNHSYDNRTGHSYSMVGKCPIGNAPSGKTRIIAIKWNGVSAHRTPHAPSLAVCFESGRLLLLLHQFDSEPVIIETGLRTSAISWNKDGTIICVAGTKIMTSSNTPASTSSKLLELHQVQLYSASGKHMCSVKVPGNGVTDVSWDASSHRLALSVDSAILFAKVVCDYKWTYFANTLVYAFSRSGRSDLCVSFWDPQTDALYFKYVNDLLHLDSGGDRCVFVTTTEDNNPSPYSLILCNAIGTPLDSKFIGVEPLYVCMSATHVVVCSDDVVLVWQYAKNHKTQTFPPDGITYMFHIDETPSPVTDNTSAIATAMALAESSPTSDPICAVTASADTLIIGRSSGSLMRYSLQRGNVQFDHRYVVRCRPKRLSLNCNSRRLAIIDINGLLTLFDLYARPAGGKGAIGEHLSFVRKDTWDLRWSRDNPTLFACMEKTKMYVIRDLTLEEPVLSKCFIAEFAELEVTAVNFEELMKHPQNPQREHVVSFHTKSLRDTETLLRTCPIEEALTFVQDNPHHRLWKLLGESALEQLNFELAEKAFVSTKDYSGIQLIKRLRSLSDRRRQRAEVAIYFRHFDEAESLYLEMGEAKLAVDLRVRLGDWLRVEKLIREFDAGNDQMLTEAYRCIGDYYADRLKWKRAYSYYDKCNFLPGMGHCAFMLDDYSSMFDIVSVVPPESSLLKELGTKFQSVGLCVEAVASFEKAGDHQAAINACIELNQWELAVEKAKLYNVNNVDNLLETCARNTLAKGRTLEAIELYRKASKHTAAANLLISLAKKAIKNRSNPIRVKQIYVLSALEIERHQKQTLGGNNNDTKKHNSHHDAQSTLAKLNSLMEDGEDTSSSRQLPSASMENPWRGAEAYHFWILAQRQLLSQEYSNAMITALRLRDYEDVLSEKDIYSLIALSAFHCEFYGQASMAIMKLETLTDMNATEQEQYKKLALSIFTRRGTKDPRTPQHPCPEAKCGGGALVPWDSQCRTCGTKFPSCVASGRVIHRKDDSTIRCSQCHHYMYTGDINTNHCPLCHGTSI